MDERIELYVDALLSEEERRQFEAELATQEGLADDFAFYLQSRIAAQRAARGNLLKEKHTQWASLPQKQPSPIFKYPWISIAASLLLFLSVIVYFAHPFQKNLSEKAKDHLHEQFNELPVNLGESEAALSKALQMYNQGRYAESIRWANEYLNQHPQDSEALQIAGLAYLQKGDYERAIAYFQQLGRLTALFSNPGKYLEGLTYAIRCQPGDEEKAKRLFNEVIDQDLEGQKAAKDILK